ncbi:MAG TPA: cysteine--tRNA ligase [Alphaproteobacteria bacterium]|nr:cysteine--tRNA ligase [Alphaproteobacteria bacterium]
MAIQIHNTLTRKKEVFTPADPACVTMYVCGPTVYNFAHIGNARPAVVFDVFWRVLKRRFGQVIYARNITDVEDKINKAALEEGVPIDVINARYTKAYHEDMGALGVQAPTIEPRVTEHIPQIVDMIGRLIEAGNAYEKDGHVLFNVPSFEAYGTLSGRNRDEMIAGARVEVAPYKKDPADFVLWKPSDETQPGWDSPWGFGRPGWHIECSAMAETQFGETIDIHGGGLDLTFPHHENELAQSTCVHGGAPFARYWMHNGFVNVDAEKMSKSLGNVLLVRDLLNEAPGEAIRFALLTAHYRQPLDWSEEGLREAKRTLDRLYRTLRALGDVEAQGSDDGVPEAFGVALEDDLNTPQAIAELHALSTEANKATEPAERKRLKAELLSAGGLLGILQADPEAWLHDAADADAINGDAIEGMIAARAAARSAKDFAEADRIRDELAAQGVQIEDGPGGTTWRRAG